MGPGSVSYDFQSNWQCDEKCWGGKISIFITVDQFHMTSSKIVLCKLGATGQVQTFELL